MRTSGRRKAFYVVLLLGALATLTFTVRDFLVRQAAASCSTSAVKFLLSVGGDPNGAGVQGRPLHHAVRCGDAALIELLLSRRADIDGGDLNGRPALLIACATGNRRIAALLLDRGAALNGVDPGYSPLRMAAQNNYVDLVKDLLARGAKPAYGNGRVVSELQVAAAAGAVDVVPLLVAAGVPLETTNHAGETPLFFAARHDARTVRAFLESGANVNVINNEGSTPLMEAVRECGSDGSDSVRLLVAAGADLQARDKRGETLAEMARKCANGAEILSILSANRASLAPAHPNQEG